MVRRFNLADILLVKRLQDQVACLDLEAAVLWSPAPLSLAMLECLPLNQGRSTTFVEDNHSAKQRAHGFIQAWDRSDGLSCAVEFIAPSLDGSTATTQLWLHLLEHLTRVKGESGFHRILAKVPEGGSAVDVFRQCGFTAYTGRHIYRLGRLPADLAVKGNKHLRPVEPSDAATLERLRSSLAPRPVQHAEGRTQTEIDHMALVPWWKSPEAEEYVWEQDGDIRAYLRVVAGEDGHWLRVLVEPETAEVADAVLSESLSVVASHPARPVYCDVREYEGGLRGALQSLGFELLASEKLMVKHTTVRARVSVDKLSPALEKGVETATPISTSNRCRNAR